MTHLRIVIATLVLAACQGPEPTATDPHQETHPGGMLAADMSRADIVQPIRSALSNYNVGAIQSRVWIGTFNDGYAYLGVRRMDSNTCTFVRLSTVPDGAMPGPLTVTLSNQGDSFQVSNNAFEGWCWDAIHFQWLDYHIMPLATTSVGRLTVNGGSGGDWIECSTVAPQVPMSCYGFAGNDHMETNSAAAGVGLEGGAGDDHLFSRALNGGLVTLNGDYGYDCLDAQPYGAAGYDCDGDGVPSGGQSTRMPIGNHCTVYVTSCPQ